MRSCVGVESTVALLFVAGISGASAQTTSPPDSAPLNLPDLYVVGTTPLPSAGLARDKVPTTTYVLNPTDISAGGTPSLTDAITRDIPSATINDVEGNTFQPDILFRGFTASPVAGTPQGLAVYVNGVRFNDPFGDTVNWDLIPSVAIRSVTVEASNPLFGLNALGGSVNVQLKNGFNFQGGSVSAYGGSYGRLGTSVEYGKQFGDFSTYISGETIHDTGFRPTQASQIRRIYGDLGWRGSGAELHLGVTGANNSLGNPGANPVQALNSDYSSIFTAPNTVTNQHFGLNLNGSYAIDLKLNIQGLAYFKTLDQNIPNGTTVDTEPCDDGSGLLCNEDGSYVTTTGGKTVPDFLNGGPYSGLSSQSLNSKAYGASMQLTDLNDLAGHGNHLVVGASFDGSNTLFSGSTYIGGFDPISREFIGPGVLQDQPDVGINPVKVENTNQYYGLFGQDIFTVAPGLDLSVAGRYNYAQVNLSDKLGGPVNGQNTFAHFNPSAGLTYRVAPWLQFYGDYSITNRAPSPQELSCASAAAPCSLLNFFVGDPPLKQVVANTFELGARGDIASFGDGRWSWNADYYHTLNNDDIVYETTPYNPNLAYYVNAGKTLRQGVELALRYNSPKLRAVIGYAYTDATFQTPLELGSQSNPQADDNGNIQVARGDRVPGIPRHRITGQVSYDVTDRWMLGGSASYQTGQYRFGDEANLTPPLKGYFLANLNTSYKVTDKITIFGLINNVFDKHYYSYGTFGPVSAVPWPNVPGGVTGNATAVPGTPFTAYAGVTVTF